MTIKYDPKFVRMTDDITRVVLELKSGPDYAGWCRYVDPAVTTIPKGNVRTSGLGPGTVALDWEYIYSRAPISTPEGRVSWGQVVGFRVSSFRLYDLYREHLGQPSNTPEVLAVVATAKDFVREALHVYWRAQGTNYWRANGTKEIQPVIDIGGELSVEVRCYIPRFPPEEGHSAT